MQADGERQAQFLQAQIDRAMQNAQADENQAAPSELRRDENGGAALQMALGKSRFANGSNSAPKIQSSQKEAFQAEDNGFDQGTFRLHLFFCRFIWKHSAS